MIETFTVSPNLPQNRVSLVLMSGRNRYLKNELEALGIRSIDPGRLSGISGSECFHADMSICHIGGNRVFCAPNGDIKMKAALQEEGFEVLTTDNMITAQKPALNICISGNNVLCDTKTADNKILTALKNEGMNILHTNQRYTKCSAALVTENAVITSDSSIYELCRNNKIDVLRISYGNIILEGYSYGFIGGCCGLISKDTLAFSGNIAMHPDYNNIRSFAGNHGVEIISLSDSILCDVGGIIPLKEYQSGSNT